MGQKVASEIAECDRDWVWRGRGSMRRRGAPGHKEGPVDKALLGWRGAPGAPSPKQGSAGTSPPGPSVPTEGRSAAHQAISSRGDAGRHMGPQAPMLLVLGNERVLSGKRKPPPLTANPPTKQCLSAITCSQGVLMLEVSILRQVKLPMFSHQGGGHTVTGRHVGPFSGAQGCCCPGNQEALGQTQPHRRCGPAALLGPAPSPRGPFVCVHWCSAPSRSPPPQLAAGPRAPGGQGQGAVGDRHRPPTRLWCRRSVNSPRETLPARQV